MVTLTNTPVFLPVLASSNGLWARLVQSGQPPWVTPDAALQDRSHGMAAALLGRAGLVSGPALPAQLGALTALQHKLTGCLSHQQPAAWLQMKSRWGRKGAARWVDSTTEAGA